ncbi:ABC transporter ATP-binding protein [Candidatus Parcubacteria bacterium]|nr:ABC transporter ATP-binding protein [Candidatus Parcubacteria bacterium]
MSLVEVKNLRKTYDNEGTMTPVLHGLNFKIEPGEFVAVMGPSGSGKSTLLQILGFLDSHSEGDYIFDGRAVAGYSKKEVAYIRNQKLGFIFQAFNLLPRTSVLQNVKLPLVYSDVPEREWETRARKAIEAVGLSHRLDHEPAQLSGGEKQRVAIARALVNEPSIIFADEPTGNLDSKSGRAVMEIIQKLNEEGHTVLLITHETSTAEYARRIIKIKDGLIESDVQVVNRRNASEHYSK